MLQDIAPYSPVGAYIVPEKLSFMSYSDSGVAAFSSSVSFWVAFDGTWGADVAFEAFVCPVVLEKGSSFVPFAAWLEFPLESGAESPSETLPSSPSPTFAPSPPMHPDRKVPASIAIIERAIAFFAMRGCSFSPFSGRQINLLDISLVVCDYSQMRKFRRWQIFAASASHQAYPSTYNNIYN